MGAKILAVAADYYTILHLWPRSVKRMLTMARRHLGPDAVAAVEIGDDVLEGRLLLTRGTVLEDGALQTIQTIGSRGMIEGAISVTTQPGEPAEGEALP